MPTRRASAKWEGGLKTGKGTFKGESGGIGGQYSFTSRFEEGVGSNPEELLAAAEAACFSMAFAGNLEKNGTPPTSIESFGACTVKPDPAGGFRVTEIALDVVGAVPGIDEAKFKELAQHTIETCPVSKSLRGNMELKVSARLQS